MLRAVFQGLIELFWHYAKHPALLAQFRSLLQFYSLLPKGAKIVQFVMTNDLLSKIAEITSEIQPFID